MYVVIKKEYEHDDKELPGSKGKKKCEGCLGLFKDFRAAQYEVAAVLFDELRYGLSMHNESIPVGGSADWKTDRDNDEMHVLEVSIWNTDFVFKAFYIDDDDTEEN